MGVFAIKKKKKSEVAQMFKFVHKMVKIQFQTNIQIFKTNNGMKYFNHLLGIYFMEYGIIHQSSCVNTLQQNGMAERKNKHLLEVARLLIFSTQVPKYI